MNTNKNILAYIALAAVCVLWGTTFLAQRVGVMEFPPLLFCSIRFLISGAILISIMLMLGKKIAVKALFSQAVGGLLMITLGVSMVCRAEVHVSSGLAAVICSMIPIWTIIINLFANKDERPTPLIVFGLLLCVSGVVLIFGEHLDEFYKSEYTNSIITIFFANVCWAFGTVWVKKRNSNTDPIVNAGVQMFFGGIFLVPLSFVLDDYTLIQWTHEIVSALLYLIFIGSVLGYACYFYAIEKLPITIVSLHAYVNPVIAVVLGGLLLNEKMNAKIFGAIAIILLGIYIVNKGYQLKSNWKTIFSKS